MPVLASGDQRFDSEVMLTALLNAAVHWLEHGLPIDTIKIVVHSQESAQRLQQVFARLRSDYTSAGSQRQPEASPSFRYDFFVSYSHSDVSEADALVEGLKAAKMGARVFQDKLELKTGDAWQTELDEALECCRKVIPIYTQSYVRSHVCMEEFNMARLRHRESESGVLLPIYLRTTQLPLYMRALQYFDCREGDLSKIRSVCRQLISALG
jgi:hypothetical protein